MRIRGKAAAAATAIALLAALAATAPASAKTREFWVAAVPTTWNIVPNGFDPIMGMRYDVAQTTIHTVVYRRFTAGWKRPWPNSSRLSADNDRIPGPLLHARVGDHLVVHFRNDDTATGNPHSMHFHGVSYRPGSDGSYVPGFSGPGGDVKPGQRFTYHLTAGPSSAGVWPYHDHSPSMHDSIAGGMYGALSILGRHQRAPDREFVVYLTSLGGFMTIDGHAFIGNTPTFHSRVGDVVQWDVLTLGDDFHTFHIHGHRWVGAGGVPQDTRTIGPAESFRVRFREDAPGTWLYHCHVESHMDMGMIGLYRVARR